ncbi:XrtN system VIT domain-containing protein [Flavobacterium circumlabens]|uniref:Secreted protein with MSEP-CTERM motif n=1 Tax=Flavobacterium circumlabens TaxID=2133765 RepID=A0A4Y7U6R5_9FLAO|nr:XrtN system VIT domain-containing protein [Flavobacterium circumlabens]TCN51118.1 putative secreted protein with MSEP-CTERM motif [Flavobacterium circumlabens]TEB41934.1 XrtN system VIT domain-containing protein [Flavobacterium circumlabens]
MKYKIEHLEYYIQKPGVTISLIVTLFSTILLMGTLVCKEFRIQNFESAAILSLLFEVLYGIGLSFIILRKKEKYIHLTPFLILNWLIGCFCLNTFIPIFHDLPIWVYLITAAFCLSNFFIYRNSDESRNISFPFFINGLSFAIILYFAIYLIPIMPLSCLGILALGLGFYGLVPAFVIIIHITTIIRYFSRNKNYSIYFGAGFLVVLFGLILFTIGLSIESRKIAQSATMKSFDENDDFPSYISISQNLKPNFFNEILLKKDIVYIPLHNIFSFEGFNSFGTKQFNERKTHNPFISIAYLFCKDLNISNDDRINILKSNFDKRLETEEQLWSGENLLTKSIKEDVKIYADARLAYTEVTMKIVCAEDSRRDREAIYSFQLPEGSVATSLSLWVNGIERKGVLTTKEKAKAAYNQIVGVESRDPSLMQWREGNKVVVKVFPVNFKNPRTFKCGFTTPLKVKNNEMKYQSLSIKGPNISNAETISRIQTVGNTKIETSKDFELKNKYYINESKGLDNWEAYLSLTKVPSSFTWKNKIYEVKDIQQTVISFSPSEIILDLNSSWTTKQIESFVNLNKKNFFVFINGEKKEINKDNFKAIALDFEDLHYSLLPLYKISQNSLIITKCGKFSANFEELENSNYLKKIKTGAKERHLKVINISSDINPFWQTVKEQKYVNYFQTSLNNSLKLIDQNHFILFKTAANTVNIEPANIAITESPLHNTAKSTGPDHIYRMYAFGKVLEEQVKIQNDSLVQNQYVDLAKDANIVTPISSLIVLETDEDYKNNGIEKNVDTLGNASVKNDGAIPEPHEWLLIILGSTILFFYYRKNKKQTI